MTTFASTSEPVESGIPRRYALIASTVTVYAGGSFTTIGGASQTYLAPLDAITGLLE